MKRLILATFYIFLFTSSQAFGDPVAKKLPGNAKPEIKTGTQNMIRSGIRSENAIRMTRAMLENQFKHEQILRAQEIVMKAHKQDLPVDPIMDKAHEGIAKNVSQEAVIRAMESVVARYAIAFQQSGEVTQKKAHRQKVMVQMAECLAAGITEYDVKRLVYRLRFGIQEMTEDEAGSLAEQTFKALKDMARLGTSSLIVTDLALTALKHRSGGVEMEKIRKSFIKHTKDASPNTVAKSFINAIHNGKRLESLNFLHMKNVDKIGEAGKSAGSGGGAFGHGGGSSGGGGKAGGGSGGPRHGKH